LYWLAIGVRKHFADPDRLNSEPVEDCESVRVSVVALAPTVPVPVSHAVPSSMAYCTTVLSGIEAVAMVLKPDVAAPAVIVPVPVVAVEKETRSKSIRKS
jgi:hypothetical protein